VKIFGVGEDEAEEGFARCTSTFLGAFFSFVTRVLVMRVARMAKAWRPLRLAPPHFVISSGQACYSNGFRVVCVLSTF
jgi:hypothetical protein